jgi:hypothetical protein
VPYLVLLYPQERVLQLLSQTVSAYRAVLMFEKEEMQNDVDSAMNHIPCPYSICHTDLCLFLVRVLGLVHDSLER